MSFQVVSIDTRLAENRAKTYEREIPFCLNGQLYHALKKVVAGEMETIEFTKAYGEMMTQASVEQFQWLLKRVVLDVELGRESIPTVYEPIYDRISDPTLPEVIKDKWALYGSVVFSQHMEGQQVKFGTLTAEQGPMAQIFTYSAGMEYDKKIKDFNESWKIELINKAIGEGYNALLNDLHLSPIIKFAYKTANITNYVEAAAGMPAWAGVYNTFIQAAKDATAKKRMGSVLLASRYDKYEIEMALKGGHQINGTVYPAISDISTIIYYDGWEIPVGNKLFTYEGVPAGTAFIIRPKRGFKELVKQDLRVESQAGDLTRLQEAQVVAYAYRGVYAAVEANVQKVILRKS